MASFDIGSSNVSIRHSCGCTQSVPMRLILTVFVLGIRLFIPWPDNFIPWQGSSTIL